MCLWMNEMVMFVFSRLKLFLSIHFVAYGIYYDNKQLIEITVQQFSYLQDKTDFLTVILHSVLHVFCALYSVQQKLRLFNQVIYVCIYVLGHLCISSEMQRKEGFFSCSVSCLLPVCMAWDELAAQPDFQMLQLQRYN